MNAAMEHSETVEESVIHSHCELQKKCKCALYLFKNMSVAVVLGGGDKCKTPKPFVFQGKIS